MAGRGSRFTNAGFKLPKPLIEIHSRPMIEYVIKNVRPQAEHRFIFLCLEEHLQKYQLKERLCQLTPGCVVIPVCEVTEGAACTVLLAEPYIDNSDALMLANSDQYVDIDINQYLKASSNPGFDGLIMTMKATDNKWSFIKYQNDTVTEVKEKEIISDQATVGIYNFSRGCDFVKYAKKMIDVNDRVNGEFYVAPVYNYMIQDGKKIGFYDIGDLDDKMHGLGVPEDLGKFMQDELSRHIFE